MNESVNIDTCKGGAGDEKCGGGKCGDTYVIFNNPVLSGGGGSGVCGSCDGQIPQTLEELAGKVADILNKPSGEVMEALRRAQVGNYRVRKSILKPDLYFI